MSAMNWVMTGDEGLIACTVHIVKPPNDALTKVDRLISFVTASSMCDDIERIHFVEEILPFVRLVEELQSRYQVHVQLAHDEGWWYRLILLNATERNYLIEMSRRGEVDIGGKTVHVLP